MAEIKKTSKLAFFCLILSLVAPISFLLTKIITTILGNNLLYGHDLIGKFIMIYLGITILLPLVFSPIISVISLITLLVKKQEGEGLVLISLAIGFCTFILFYWLLAQSFSSGGSFLS